MSDALGYSRYLFRIKDEFRRAEDDLPFVTRSEDVRQTVRRKAFFVCWQTPGLFRPLLDMLIASDEYPMNRARGSRTEYVRKLLAQIIGHERRFPDPRIDTSPVPEMLKHSDPSRVFNGLYLLEPMVSEEHLDALRPFSRDK